MSSDATDVLAAVDELFEQSRSAEGRTALASGGVPRALSLLLPSALEACLRERSEAVTDQLLNILRTLRNACAGVVDAKAQLHDAHCAEHLALLLCALAREPALERRSLLLATALQVLGNSSVQHARNQAATWCVACLPAHPGALTLLAREACFPTAFAEAAGVTGASPAATRARTHLTGQTRLCQVRACTLHFAWSYSCAAVGNQSACLHCAAGQVGSSLRTCLLRARRR